MTFCCQPTRTYIILHNHQYVPQLAGVYVCALLDVHDHLVYLLQMLFMCYALGGPQAWKGKNMYEAHKALNLKEEHFNAVAGHFIATLQVSWFIQSLSSNHVDVAWPPSPGIVVRYNSMQLVRSYMRSLNMRVLPVLRPKPYSNWQLCVGLSLCSCTYWLQHNKSLAWLPPCWNYCCCGWYIFISCCNSM